MIVEWPTCGGLTITRDMKTTIYEMILQVQYYRLSCRRLVGFWVYHEGCSFFLFFTCLCLYSILSLFIYIYIHISTHPSHMGMFIFPRLRVGDIFANIKVYFVIGWPLPVTLTAAWRRRKAAKFWQNCWCQWQYIVMYDITIYIYT